MSVHGTTLSLPLMGGSAGSDFSATQKCARFLVRHLAVLDVKGEVPEGGCVVASNHPSWGDGLIASVVLEKHHPHFVAWRHTGVPGFCVSKVMGLHPGVLFTDKKDVVSKGAAAVREGSALWIVPAGQCYDGVLSESKDAREGMVPRKGASAVALCAQKPVVPMAVDPEGSRTFWSNVKHAAYAGVSLLGGTVGSGVAYAAWHSVYALSPALLGVAVASCMWKQVYPVEVHVRIGEAIQPPVVREEASEEERTASVQEHTYRVAAAVNALVKAKSGPVPA